MSKCARCSNTKVTGRRLCTDCIISRTAQRMLGTRGKKGFLSEMFNNQEGRCFYTNEPISRGVNASIDHVKPRSKNRELAQCPDNLVWVHEEVNAMKSNMDIMSFLRRCQQVLEGFGYKVTK